MRPSPTPIFTSVKWAGHTESSGPEKIRKERVSIKAAGGWSHAQVWNTVVASEWQGWGGGRWDPQDRELGFSKTSGSLLILTCWAELLTVLGERLRIRLLVDKEGVGEFAIAR